MHWDSSYIELIILAANISMAIMNNMMRSKMKEIHNQIKISALTQESKIQALETMIYKEFLTKGDFYSSLKTERKS
jgi:hypothetical protein